MSTAPSRRSPLARRRPGQAGERGAVAVEYVLVVSLFLAIVGVGSTFGRYLETRLTLTNMAAFMVRACAQAYPLTLSQIDNCPSDLLPQAVQIFRLDPACSPTLGVQSDVLSTAGLAAETRQLTVLLECSANQGKTPDADIAQGVGSAGIAGFKFSLGSSFLQARASLPYLVPPTLPPT